MPTSGIRRRVRRSLPPRRNLRPALVLALLYAVAAPTWAVQVTAGPSGQSPPDPGWTSFRTFGSAEGLPQSTVYALAQDRAGFVWAGTQVGLARYDTRRWQPVSLPGDGVPPLVSRLAVTGDGALWIGTADGGLLRLVAGEARPVGVGERRLQSIEALLGAGRDAVWAGTAAGLFRCAPGGCREVTAARGLAVSALASGSGPAGPALWVGTAFDGVRRLDLDPAGGARLADWRLSREEGLPDSAVRSLALWLGDLWVGSGRGLSRLDGERLVVYDETIGFRRSAVLVLEPGRGDDGEPCLWAGQLGGGISRFDAAGAWYRLGGDDGLPEEYIRSLLVTGIAGPQPMLWIGTGSSGVVRQERGRWRAWGERSGLPHRSVVGIGELVEPGAGPVIWAGTLAGPVRWTAGRWRPWLAPTLAGRVLYDAVAMDGVLWLATDRGLARWDGRVATWFTVDNSALPGLSVHDLELRRGPGRLAELWATTNHGLARFTAGQLSGFEIGQPFVEPHALAAGAPTLDGGQQLWLAAGNGIFLLEGETWQPLPAECAPRREVIHLLWQGDTSVLWAVHRGGLSRIAAETGCHTFGPRDGIHPPVYQLALDRLGYLYLFGHDGVARLATDLALGGRPRLQRFGLQDGLPDLEFNRAALTDSRGRIWAATVGGIAAFDPGEEPPRAAPGPLQLLRASRGDGTPLRPATELPHDAADASFDFVLLSYGREDKIRYRTQLLGLEQTPGDWQPAAGASYRRLPPGSYRFAAWARDPHGNVVGPLELPFAVATPWWRAPWALGLAALALVAAGAGLGRLRARALSRRAEELERLVGERTLALAEANQQLADAAITDPLTGARNRRYLDLRLSEELARARRRVRRGDVDGHLALVLIDVDRFKAINDRFGHAIGDEVLRQVAARLRQLVREEDFLVRWGGEEFLVLLRDVDRRGLEGIARRVLREIAGRKMTTAGGMLQVTCSAGVVPFPIDGERLDFDPVVRLADQALYAAKEGGRHRAVVIQPGAAGALARTVVLP